jgi:hypothetical protein
MVSFFDLIYLFISELYCYAYFFQEILHRVCKNIIKQMVTVVEWKHIFGMVFDENGIITLEREL